MVDWMSFVFGFGMGAFTIALLVLLMIVFFALIKFKKD